MTPTGRSARGLAAFPCGLCHSTLADEPTLTPYFMYLVAHPDGYVLFDCGLPAEQLTGACTVIIDGITYRIEADDNCSALALLKSFDLTPADLKAVVISHLHFDHAGGLPSLNQVQIQLPETSLID
jgi:glyoxylase-like metal-dependent hydrolase (beta-lactamase superfamily II)